MDDSENLKIAVTFFKRLIEFTKRNQEDCPHCGQHVTDLEKVGRCVYANPCGCRIMQGHIPSEWKHK